MVTRPAKFDPQFEWAFLDAGGTTRGSAAVPSILNHLHLYGYPDAWAGTSNGSLHAALGGQGDAEKLPEIYRTIENTQWFQKANLVPWRWNRLIHNAGLFHFGPLDKQLTKYLDFARTEIPDTRVYMQMFNMQRMKPVILAKSDAVSFEHYKSMIKASCAQPLIHNYERVYIPKLGTPQICVDGGMQNIVPDLPEWWRYRNIRVFLKAPLDRRKIKSSQDVDSFLEMASRAFDTLMAHVIERNLERLRSWADFGPRIYIHAPGDDIGGAFDASPETRERRLGPIGDRMWENPLVMGD